MIVEYEYVDECGGNVSNESRMVILDPWPRRQSQVWSHVATGWACKWRNSTTSKGLDPSCINGEAPLEDAPWLDLPD